MSGAFDIVKFVAAVAGDDTGYWNALASASATFDIFSVSLSGEVVHNTDDSGDLNGDSTDYGFGGSIGAAVTDGVSINLGGRWYHDEEDGTGDSNNGWQAAVQLVAAVTETVTLTGEVGAYGNDLGNDANTVYGAAQASWVPGGGFSSSLRGEVYGNGGYKTTFKAAKTFE